MNLAAGTTLAHYRITGELGAGGMGEVWKAEDLKRSCQVGCEVSLETSGKVPTTLGICRIRIDLRCFTEIEHNGAPGVCQ